MQKNLTTNQLLLLAMATVLLLLTALSFYLLQDPSAPLPFAPPPSTLTSTPLPPSLTNTIAPSSTSTPTRQTSYTPFASSVTPNLGTPSEEPTSTGSATLQPTRTTSPRTPTNTTTINPSGTPTRTITSTPGNATTSPTATETLAPGEIEVTGRVVQNATPMANVVVDFADDAAPRQDTTDPSGHYHFISLAPGTSFSLTFNQVDNPQLAPTAEVASLAWIEGTLPVGSNIIQLPDFEISLNINNILFEPQSPADGATYSAAAIGQSNPIQFNWTVYNQAVSYYVELGLNGNDQPYWSSNDTTQTSVMWDGILDDGSHISQGGWWWRVAATKSLGNYTLVVYTQQRHIIFIP